MFFQNYSEKINDLNKYKKLLIKYYDSRRTDTFNSSNEKDTRLREIIHQKTYKIINYIKKAGIKTTTTIHSDDDHKQTKDIDIFINVFNTTIPGVTEQTRIDILNYTIGAYTSAKENHTKNKFNPIYIISEIIRTPYYLLDAIGFNYNKIEKSIYGKIYKITASAIFIIVALLKGANLLGFNTAINNNHAPAQHKEVNHSTTGQQKHLLPGHKQ